MVKIDDAYGHENGMRRKCYEYTSVLQLSLWNIETTGQSRITSIILLMHIKDNEKDITTRVMTKAFTKHKKVTSSVFSLLSNPS